MVSAMNLHPLTPEQKNEYTRIAYYYYEAGRRGPDRTAAGDLAPAGEPDPGGVH